jgi:hypothetical protein
MMSKSATAVAGGPHRIVSSPRVVAALRPLPEQVRLVAVTSPAHIFIQAGGFLVRDNAQRVQWRIASLGSV